MQFLKRIQGEDSRRGFNERIQERIQGEDTMRGFKERIQGEDTMRGFNERNGFNERIQ